MLKAQNAFQINVLNGNAIMNVKFNSKPMEVEMFIYLQCHTETYDLFTYYAVGEFIIS